MPKVKILIATETSQYEYDDYYTQHILRQGITDWEDISEEDLDFLQKNRYNIIDREKYGHDAYPIVLVQDDITLVDRISSIREFIKKQEEKRKKLDEEMRKKREAAALKKKLAQAAKTEAEEKALLEALKAKYDDKEV